jgi:hypothetical protein
MTIVINILQFTTESLDNILVNSQVESKALSFPIRIQLFSFSFIMPDYSLLLLFATFVVVTTFFHASAVLWIYSAHK